MQQAFAGNSQTTRAFTLARLEDQEGELSDVEVDEPLRLVRDVGPEVLADNDVPGWVVLLVELLLYVRSNVLLDVEALHRLDGTVYRILLHVLGHVCILDVDATLAHFCFYEHPTAVHIASSKIPCFKL